MKKRIVLILSLILVAAGFASAQTARKTITNDDLEKFRDARVKADAEYRANYKKLGMPSPEELEQREAERQIWLSEYAQKKAAENGQTENYFQARANQLKTEIIGVQAQINYLRGQVGNLPSNQSSIFVTPDQLGSVSVVGVIGGYYSPRGGSRGGYGGGRGNYNLPRAGVAINAPNVQAAINNAASAPNPYAGTPLERVGVKAVIGQSNIYGRGGYGRGRVPYYGGYAVPYAVNNNSNQRDELVSRLSYLEQVKAGLRAQFEALREEARQAGVRID